MSYSKQKLKVFFKFCAELKKTINTKVFFTTPNSTSLVLGKSLFEQEFKNYF
jgi:hypothetical protein